MSRRMSASGAFSTSARRFIISSVIGGSSVCVCDSQPEPTEKPPMTAASRSLATALWRARFASGLLRRSYTTNWDTTDGRTREAAIPDRDGNVAVGGEDWCEQRGKIFGGAHV